MIISALNVFLELPRDGLVSDGRKIELLVIFSLVSSKNSMFIVLFLTPQPLNSLS